MNKTFIVTSLSPFDLLRWDKDSFYDILDQEYFEKFRIKIEILEANLSFVKNGIKVKIITFKNDN